MEVEEEVEVEDEEDTGDINHEADEDVDCRRFSSTAFRPAEDDDDDDDDDDQCSMLRPRAN